MEFLDVILLYIQEIISAIGAAIITVGAMRAVYQMVMNTFYNNYSSDHIRLLFGDSIVLGLEFTVAGDIIGSLVKPDYYNLGLLAIIVVIRTVLSYFLNKELQALTPQQKQDLK